VHGLKVGVVLRRGLARFVEEHDLGAKKRDAIDLGPDLGERC